MKMIRLNESKQISSRFVVNENYRGCPEVDVIDHGQADPDLVYDGYTFNYWDIEDALWGVFLEATGYSDDMSGDSKVEAEFDEYVQDNCVSYLEDVIAGGYFSNGSKTWHTWHNESLNKKRIKEELELPVVPLSESELDSICRDVYTGKKGSKIVLGCFSYVRGIAANYDKGKIDKKTGEVYPLVKAIKCYESQVSTGTEYGNHQTVINRNNTDAWKARHPEDEVRDPRIREWIYPNVLGISSAGNKVFTYFPNTANRPKVTYYISIDNEDYRACTKEEIAKYMSPSAADKFLAPYEAPEDASTNVNFRMATASQIYKLHTMGNTFMMNSKTNDNIDRKALRNNPPAIETPVEDSVPAEEDIPVGEGFDSEEAGGQLNYKIAMLEKRVKALEDMLANKM